MRNIHPLYPRLPEPPCSFGSPADNAPPESALRPELLSSPSVRVVALPNPPALLDTSTAPRFIVFAPFKALWQLLTLWWLLMYTLPPATGCLLVQNPPSFPTLVVARCVAALRGMAVVIDWHNFGWTILRLKLQGHPIVWLLKLYVLLRPLPAFSNMACPATSTPWPWAPSASTTT